MAELNKSKVNRKCKFFYKSAICSLIQPDCNCYQCPIANSEIYKKDLFRVQNELDKLKRENQKLKILLANKIIADQEAERKDSKYILHSDCYDEGE